MKNLKTALLGLLLVFSEIGMAQQLIFPQAPAQPTARFFGTTGATSRYYWVLGRYPWGISIVSTSAGITNGNATLSSANIINVTWATTAGATGYDLLRTATNVAPTGSCNCALLVNSTSTSYNDVGNALLTYTLATPGLVFADATAQTSAAVSVGGLTTAKLASVNDTANNLPVVSFTGAASTVNNINAASATTTNPPILSAVGSDTNIDIKLTPKGTGIINVPLVTYSAELTITTANLNAGTSNVIVPAVVGRTYTVTGFLMRALGGNTAGCTLVELTDTAAVLVVSEAIAGLVQNQGINEGSAVSNLTFGAGWAVPLTTGEGIKILQTGSACTTATSFTARVFYKIS